ncbi:hypothetical protein NQ315_000941 [Exocentrus adspersus]|uniref:RPA43 OB domain-containing protein n=1 Tax=Exocentrus adspersus TaxID=1586481 RepID=A0AAV8WDX3_9CUCU|nr:hypothetical protein NQ315_000941 [Exocentrus adspersus]
MGKFRIGIDFDKKYLQGLTKEENSGVELQTSKHHLALYPTHLRNFNKSVKDSLNEGIAKYNKKIWQYKTVIEYGNNKRRLPPVYIMTFWLTFFVFKPEIGKEMQGIVKRKSKDHVGLLVYNVFNVSIPKPVNGGEWLGDSVDVGYNVLFKITFIDYTLYLPYIKGELMSVISEVDNELTFLEESTVKRKKIIFDQEEDEEQPAAKHIKLEAEFEDPTQQRKSKKKKEKKKR